jgi:hypothetical protein
MIAAEAEFLREPNADMTPNNRLERPVTPPRDAP